MRKLPILKKGGGLWARLAAFAVVLMMTTMNVPLSAQTVVNSESELNTAIGNISSGDTIQLGADIDLNATMNVASGKDFTLDMNGHKLARSSSVSSETKFTLINIVANGTLKIIDSDGTSNTRYWIPDATTKQWVLQASQPEGTEGVDYFTTTGGVITGGYNSSGGAIYNAGNLTITGGNITGNYASSSSGGIYSKGTLTITGGNITGNYSNSSTGGIYNTGTLMITGGNITGNSAKSYGGGIYNYKDGTLTITDGNITGNSANNTGGGIYNNGKLTITGGNVTGNSAKSYGGGIYYDGGVAGANPYLKMVGNVVVTGNTVNGNANNVCVYKGTITLSTGTPLTTGANIGATIKDGTGTFATGATADDAQYFTVDNSRCYMEFDSGNLVLKHDAVTLTVTSNADSGEGSLREALTNALDGDMIVFNLPEGQKTITLASKLPTISHAITIEGSGVTLDGGHTASETGYQILPASGLKTGTLLAINNVTFTNAGATALNATSNYGEIVLTNCKFLNNHNIGTGKSGGAIYCKDSSVTVNNGLFVGNTAGSNGGAVYVNPNTDGYTTKMVLNNCTLTGNSAASDGSGNAVYAIAGKNKIYTVELNNCIVVDNTGSSTEIYGATGTGCTLTCTNVLGTEANWTNVTTQTGTVAYDNTKQLFKNKTSGDYSIVRGSQAWNAGDNTKVPETLTKDLAGNARIAHSTVDLGAYEISPIIEVGTEEELNTAIANAIAGDTIQLGADINLNATMNVASGKDFTLDLNSCVLKALSQDAAGKRFSVITNAGTLTIIDSNPNATHTQEGLTDITGGIITGGYGKQVDGSYTLGGGIYNQGTLTMNGGTIAKCSNQSGSGSAVYNVKDCTFTLDGGTITQCTVGNSGAVYNAGTFEMKSGSIAKCSASATGGVSNSGTFNMYSGSITDNSSTAIGGVSNSGTFNMYGGCIENCSGMYGGVYNSSTMKVSGSPKVTNNKTIKNVTNNVFLKNGKTITIESAGLQSGAEIGVTMQTGIGTFATGATADDAKYFSSDVNKYHVNYSEVNKSADGFLLLESHSWKYTAVANVLYAYCEMDGCPYYGTPTELTNAVTDTLVANDMNYSGEPYNGATLIDGGWTELGITAPTTIEYEGRGSTTYIKCTTPPTAPGLYTASVTKNQDPTKTAAAVAKADFQIRPKITFSCDEGSEMYVITGYGTEDADTLTSGDFVDMNTVITAAGGEGFLKWTAGKDGAVLSTDNPYIFTITDNTVLYGNFNVKINIYANPLDGGEVAIKYTETGEYIEGDDRNSITYGKSVTIEATAHNELGYTFAGWFNKNTGMMFSGKQSYTFDAKENLELEARFTDEVIWIKVKK